MITICLIINIIFIYVIIIGAQALKMHILDKVLGLLVLHWMMLAATQGKQHCFNVVMDVCLYTIVITENMLVHVLCGNEHRLASITVTVANKDRATGTVL